MTGDPTFAAEMRQDLCTNLQKDICCHLLQCLTDFRTSCNLAAAEAPVCAGKCRRQALECRCCSILATSVPAGRAAQSPRGWSCGRGAGGLQCCRLRMGEWVGRGWELGARVVPDGLAGAPEQYKQKIRLGENQSR